MPTFNSITGQGVPPPSSDVGSAGGIDLESAGGADMPLGPDTPQSIDIIEKVPPPDPWAVPINTGGTSPVGGGPYDPRPESSPVPVAAPKPAKPRLAPPIVSGLGKDVDKILNQSPTMRALWERAKQKDYHIEFRNGPNQTEHGDKKIIYINPRSLNDGHLLTTTELASLASHEIDHAARGPLREVVDADRESYVRNSTRAEIANEAAAALTNARVRDEIRTAGGPDIGIRGNFDDEYIAIYERRKSGAIPDDAMAIAEMALVAGREERFMADGRRGTTEEVFMEKNRKAFDEKAQQ